MIRMFVSHQNFSAAPLVVYEHVYEVSSLYYIGKLGFQNPCFSTDSREIVYIYIYLYQNQIHLVESDRSRYCL